MFILELTFNMDPLISPLPSFIIFTILLPLILLISCGVFLFRQIIRNYLTRKYGSRFLGFIDRPDLTLSQTEQGVCTFMAFIEIQKKVYHPTRTILEILQRTRRRFQETVFEKHPLYFNTRRRFVYDFWLKDVHSQLIDNFVRLIHFSHFPITVEQLRQTVSEVCNLRIDNGMEVLIGNRPIEAGKSFKFPILLRIHHSILDEATVVKLLMEEVQDMPEESRDEWKRGIQQKMIDHLGVRPYIEMIDRLHTIFFTPFQILIDYGFCRNVQKLTGQKTVHWMSTCELETIRRIKRKFPGVRHQDIVTAIISRVFGRYFEAKSKVVETLTVITSERSQLTTYDLGRYGHALIYQEIPTHNGTTVEDFQNRLTRIRDSYPSKHFLAARNFTTDIFGKYMHCIGSFTKSQCTLGLSIVAGTRKKLKIGGYDWHDLTYFGPCLKGSGVSCTIFTYDGKLQLAIVADKATTLNDIDIAAVLKGTVKEIKNLAMLLNV